MSDLHNEDVVHETGIQEQQLVQADKLLTLGTLVTGVAHEINNPNQTVMMNASMLMRAWDSITPILDQYYDENGDFLVGGTNYTDVKDRIPTMFSRLVAGSERIKQIVAELQDFARQPSSSGMESVNINEVVNSGITVLSSTIKKSTNNFAVEYCDDLPRVHGNFRRIEQVLINLILNACMSLPDNLRGVTVSMFSDGEPPFVVLKISDEGTGIQEEDIPHICDPFFTNWRELGGVGLGLSVASTIVKEHGGTMSFFSTPGKGTTVTVMIPAEN